MKKLLILLLAAGVLAGCSEKEKAEPVEAEENTEVAVEETDSDFKFNPKETIFGETWNTFRDRWSGSVGVDELKIIYNHSSEEGVTFRYNGQINKYLYVSANVFNDTKTIQYANVMGLIQADQEISNRNILKAAVNLIELTDSTISRAKREEIILTHLGLGDGVILEEGSMSYTYRGIEYESDYDVYDHILTVGVRIAYD